MDIFCWSTMLRLYSERISKTFLSASGPLLPLMRMIALALKGFEELAWVFWLWLTSRF
ncbi:MAG: hypothetical protein RL288_41 [Actinomycetota bacterium]